MNFNLFICFKNLYNGINSKKILYLENNKSFNFIIIKNLDINIFLKIKLYYKNFSFAKIYIKNKIKKNFVEYFSNIKYKLQVNNYIFYLEKILFFIYFKKIFFKNFVFFNINNIKIDNNEISLNYLYILRKNYLFINYNFNIILLKIFRKKNNKYLFKFNFKKYEFKNYMKTILLFKCCKINLYYLNIFLNYKNYNIELLNKKFIKNYNYIIFNLNKFNFETILNKENLYLELRITDKNLLILSKKKNIFFNLKIKIKKGKNEILFLNLENFIKIFKIFENHLILYYDEEKNLILSDYNVKSIKNELLYTSIGNL